MKLRPTKGSRVPRVLSAPLLLALVGAAVIAAPTASQATTPKPTVTNFAAAPTSLTASGGSVTLSAQVDHATSCAFSSKPALSGLPATVPCSSGTVSQAVTVPAITRATALTYAFHLAVTGTTTVNAPVVKLTQAGVPPKPKVTNFAASATSLSASGGSVTLSAQVDHATSCAFSSTPALSGLPATVPCSSGTVSQGVTVPANKSTTAKMYHFHLAVTGTTTMNAKAVTVTVAGVPPKPTVTNFAAAPTSLTASGGSVTLSAQVDHATSCAFSSTPTLSGLPATVPCSSGTVSQAVTVPAITRPAALTYAFHLAVTGTTTVNAPVVRLTQAGVPPKPTVSNFAAAPTSLSASGGSVSLSAQVDHATSCAFSSTPALSGLPATVPCSSGTVSQGVTVPGNTSTTAKMYHFHLAVTGTTTLNAKAVTVTVAGVTNMPGSGTIDGNVTTQGGLPLNGVCLQLFNTTYTKSLKPFAASGNPTDGAFTQAHVPDGTYIGLFENCGANTSGTGPDANYESIFYGPGSGGPFQPNGASTITITNGATTNLGTSAIPLGGTVTGTVTDTTAGAPAYPIAVAVEIPGSSNYNIDSPGGFGFMIVCAGMDGTYSVSGVPSGAQIVFSPNNWACPDNGNFNFSEWVQSTSSPVSLTPDGSVVVNGSVTEAPPAPSAAARVANPCTGVGPCRAG